MQARKPDSEGKYIHANALYYNVCFKNGSLLNRVTQHFICGVSPKDIDWVWVVEEQGRATLEEIRTLCKPPRR